MNRSVERTAGAVKNFLRPTEGALNDVRQTLLDRQMPAADAYTQSIEAYRTAHPRPTLEEFNAANPANPNALERLRREPMSVTRVSDPLSSPTDVLHPIMRDSRDTRGTDLSTDALIRQQLNGDRTEQAQQKKDAKLAKAEQKLPSWQRDFHALNTQNHGEVRIARTHGLVPLPDAAIREQVGKKLATANSR